MQSLEKSLTLLQLRFTLPDVGRLDVPLCFGYQQLREQSLPASTARRLVARSAGI